MDSMKDDIDVHINGTLKVNIDQINSDREQLKNNLSTMLNNTETKLTTNFDRKMDFNSTEFSDSLLKHVDIITDTMEKRNDI